MLLDSVLRGGICGLPCPGLPLMPPEVAGGRRLEGRLQTNDYGHPEMDITFMGVAMAPEALTTGSAEPEAGLCLDAGTPSTPCTESQVPHTPRTGSGAVPEAAADAVASAQDAPESERVEPQQHQQPTPDAEADAAAHAVASAGGAPLSEPGAPFPEVEVEGAAGVHMSSAADTREELESVATVQCSSAAFLKTNNLEQYTAAFIEHGYDDIDDILHLEYDDLQTMMACCQVKQGHMCA